MTHPRTRALLSLPLLIGIPALAWGGLFSSWPEALAVAVLLATSVWFGGGLVGRQWPKLILSAARRGIMPASTPPADSIAASCTRPVACHEPGIPPCEGAPACRLRYNAECIGELENQLAAAQREAERAAAAKDIFLANIGHEIRTPMNSVIAMIHLVKQGEISAAQRDHLDCANRAAHGLLFHINGVLDYVKLEAGDLRLEEVGFELDELLQTVVDLTAPAAGRKSIKLRMERDPKVPRLLVGDARRLRQVLGSLADNAVKFTEQGEVSIACRLIEASKTRAQIAFEVRDTGIGIAPQQQLALFDPFAQADPSITRRSDGSGLGLSICHRLVEAMGGRLSVDSRPADGSSFGFTLSLPLAPERRSADSREGQGHARISADHESPRCFGSSPVVPLLDLSNARLRLQHDERLLRRLLLRFRIDHGCFVDDYASLHGSGDVLGASQLALALESAATSLGARQVKDAASRLAMKRRAGDDPADDLKLVQYLLDAVLMEIQAHLAGMPAQPSEELNQPSDGRGRRQRQPLDVDTELNELADLLANFDAAAINRFTRLQRVLSGATSRDHIEGLRQAINGFDFSNARARLQVVADELGIRLAETG